MAHNWQHRVTVRISFAEFRVSVIVSTQKILHVLTWLHRSRIRYLTKKIREF